MIGYQKLQDIKYNIVCKYWRFNYRSNLNDIFHFQCSLALINSNSLRSVRYSILPAGTTSVVIIETRNQLERLNSSPFICNQWMFNGRPAYPRTRMEKAFRMVKWKNCGCLLKSAKQRITMQSFIMHDEERNFMGTPIKFIYRCSRYWILLTQIEFLINNWFIVKYKTKYDFQKTEIIKCLNEFGQKR